MTGPTDVATKPSDFYCRSCRKDVSVLTHGHHEILWHFQGSKHFPRDQRLRLETPGWEVLDYAPYILRGLCLTTLLAVLVHHPEWDVSADFVSLHQLGKVARELRR